MTWPNDTGVDLEYWNARLLWRLDEAVAIEIGVDPRIFITEDKGDAFGEKLKGPKLAMNEVSGYRDRLKWICVLARNGEFPILKDGANDDVPMFWCVKPDDYRRFINGPSAPALWPWGTHETDLLRKLRAAATKFWQLYDPSDPSTAPTNQQVIDWLVPQGVAKRVAEVMAQILRADDLPRGPRS